MATDSAVSFLWKAREELEALDALVEHERIAEWVIGFHAQQIAEKVLKALLIHHGRSPRKVHDLFTLSDELQQLGVRLPAWSDDLVRLSPFAVTLRYDNFHLAAEWDQSDIRTLAIDVYDWAAGQLGRSPYRDYDDFEDDEDYGEDQGDDEAGPDGEDSPLLEYTADGSQVDSDFDNMPF